MTEAKLAVAICRSTALMNFYSAERRAGADPLLANERMHFFAARLDNLENERDRDLSVIKSCLERKS